MNLPLILKKRVSYKQFSNEKYVFNSVASKAVVKIPSHAVTPYNAQATLHFYEAFWALYLPVTVAGRVSDIWRSYFR